jgi:hypothetical protein
MGWDGGMVACELRRSAGCVAVLHRSIAAAVDFICRV